ncbi:Oidioi.mRNA.OKI2018_I69.XSR.g14099.t1.cds [Oikopleura dioica]|uniref:Alpha-1,3-mannosyl-glycoprotein 2-beta-N-acetylglucosaminyltransferase n=1 Tax=Oikopleura dioica TaxID=34765 RepID=A0ABN7SF27_OIKDI|nr:Oidioi.mRNA.OKI2018_I69.XSR.g14099.t1.cds [Oikopleura dioica]
MGVSRLVPSIWAILVAVAAFFFSVVSYLLLNLPSGIVKSKTTHNAEQRHSCSWSGEDAERRATFCGNQKLFEMFRTVCSCTSPAPISFQDDPGLDALEDVPILVMAANRPKYLFRTLFNILNAEGVNRANIVVSIDGFFAESVAVANLFAIRVIQSKPEGTKAARVSQHYRRALTTVMNEIFSTSEHIIVIEDDLQISPDFFHYMAHVMPIFKMDPQIYCVSAWNDHGMEHAIGNAREIYRVEGMPGLGWATSRAILDELLPKWLPKERMTDWDVWMRNPSNRKGRDCLIPDISRTFHFGEEGLNVDRNMQGLYFRHHGFHQDSKRVDFTPLEQLVKEKYEELLKSQISSATVIDSKTLACDSKKKQNPYLSLLTGATSTHILYYSQDSKEELDNYFRLCWCLNIWDLDVRAQYHGVIRIHLQRVPVYLVAYPASRFSGSIPAKLSPLLLDSSIPKGNRRRT